MLFCCSDVRWKNEPAYGREPYKPTPIEHGANTITHALWIAPSVYCSLVMMGRASTEAEWFNAIIFGGALLSLFSVSTIFHWLSWSGRAKTLRFYLHISDRAVIYLFIAASYTPWLTLLKVGVIGYCLRWLVWLLAFLGIIYSYCFYEKYKRLETAFYIIMGLGPSIVVFEVHDLDGIYELALGGLIYIVGVIFFKSDGIIPCAHAIWHMFVVAGAGFHFYAINTYLMGNTTVSANTTNQVHHFGERWP
ncbi:monocyte to macrophage differentiation factor-like [Amphiura filiformis]|uniref:monocyte to macrophage differentiation factor-like n=1 Tax=Amphiura filiformis TaxID=82378 RepID=UPI003B22494F